MFEKVVFKKIVVLILLLTFSTLTFAKISPEQVEHVNKTVKQTGQLTENCPNCNAATAGASAPPNNTIQACVENLCPNDFSISHILNNAYERTSADPVFESDIAPLVRRIATENARAEIATGAGTEEWLRTATPLTDINAIRMFNMWDSISTFSNFEYALQNDAYVIDASSSRTNFPGLSDAEYRRKVQIAGYILNSPTDRPFADTDPGVLRLHYPGPQLAERIHSVANDLRTRFRAIGNASEFRVLNQTPSFMRMLDDAEIEAILTSETINAETIEYLNGVHSVAVLFEKVIQDEAFRTLLTTPAVDIKAYAARKEMPQIIFARRLQAENFLRNGDPRLYTTCRTTFNMGQEFLPSEENVANFKRKESALKTKFKNGIGSFLSGPSKILLNPMIDRWAFTYPQTRREHLNSLKQSLQKSADEAARWEQDKREIDASEVKNQLYAFGLPFVNREDSSEYKNADDTCESHMPEITPDSAYAKHEGLTVGPLALKNAAAEGIIFHEMGHLLYSAMQGEGVSQHSRGWFNRSKECLSENHLELDAYYGAYDIEDWADLVAGLVTRSESNFACVFTRNSDSAAYRSYSTKNNIYGSHSSDLFRLLHLAHLSTGEIPPVCTAALRQQGETPRFTNCAAR